MIIKNAAVVCGDFKKRRTALLIEKGLISEISETIDGDDTVDFSGCTAVPGFIDVHIHGFGGGDVDDASEKSLEKMSFELAKRGITSFCPTTMTSPHDALLSQLGAVKAYIGKEKGAYIHGVNMEGPYISYEKKGAQDERFIRKPDIGEFLSLASVCDIVLVDVAPEVSGACEFAREASKVCTVSAAHTAASYDEAVKGFESGFSHATHLFNAMTPVSQRAPGIIPAVFDSKTVTAEFICDGFHVHPSLIRSSFRLLGRDRTVVISDAMKAAGCPDGTYTLGGTEVFVKNGRALLKDGTIAASTSNIYDEYKNLISFGIDEEQALRSCTINPARVIGKDKITGSIEKGKSADILFLDGENNIRAVMIRGKFFDASGA
ncbi:MAG: N-acetylglucosamine-6-phosphate deacetylase [Clostridiales bacterium]|nr:N-acetylglucosamine-6-phosphate deacetylase [Clostridiales bacterium]